jgi:CheY-like chemotaxis protein
VANLNDVTILLVEDDPGHARLIVKNLRRAGLTNQMTILSNGQEAVDYLFGQGEYDGTPHYSSLLILLDLNLPIMDGYDVLRQMKSDERTKYIPVIILTTTDDVREVRKCYELGCSIYITKPVDYEKFSESIRKLGLFLSVVTVLDGE